MLFTRGHPGMLLATRRVAVVSGLALGSDGAAHVGARGRRRAMAVVPPSTSSTLRRQARLWGEVGERGVLLAEAACPSRERCQPTRCLLATPGSCAPPFRVGLPRKRRGAVVSKENARATSDGLWDLLVCSTSVA